MLSTRMQPWVTALPIEPGSLVPCTWTRETDAYAGSCRERRGRSLGSKSRNVVPQSTAAPSGTTWDAPATRSGRRRGQVRGGRGGSGAAASSAGWPAARAPAAGLGAAQLPSDAAGSPVEAPGPAGSATRRSLRSLRLPAKSATSLTCASTTASTTASAGGDKGRTCGSAARSPGLPGHACASRVSRRRAAWPRARVRRQQPRRRADRFRRRSRL